MLGTLAVFYLFLGGAGAGVLSLCSLIDLAWLRQPFGSSSYNQGPSISPVSRIVDCGFLGGFLCLIVGMCALLFDLVRADRVLLLFLSPSFSWLTFGSFALVVLAFAGGFLVLVRFVYVPEIRRSLVSVIEGAVLVVAVVVMAYTGFLLQSVGGVAFWESLLIPVLFLLSSLSSGVAVLFGIGLFVEENGRSHCLFRGLLRADVVIIVLEAVCAGAFLAIMSGSDNPGILQSVATLTRGNEALVWWFGFGLCGLIAPLILEVLFARGRTGVQVALACVAVLVLVGAFSLRWGIVESGTHREPVLESMLDDGSWQESDTMAHDINMIRRSG